MKKILLIFKIFTKPRKAVSFLFFTLFSTLPVQIIKLFYRIINLVFGKSFQLNFFSRLQNELDLKLNNDGIYFDGSSKSGASRAYRFLTKEPETLYWINTFFKPEDTFYDIGANLGVYSLYAAKKVGSMVVAFEPESLSYSVLNKNIYYNQLQDKIMALNIALHDEDIISNLNISKFEPGRSSHNFYEELDHNHKKFVPAHKQSVIGMKLDTFLLNENIPFPNHIKIDVDGNEHKIIKGMQNCLEDERLKTIMIEVHMKLDVHKELINSLKNYNFYRLKDDKFINEEYEEIGTPNIFFARSK